MSPTAKSQGGVAVVLREIGGGDAVRLLAMLAQNAHQALADNGPHAGREKKALDPHVDQSRDRARSGVGVQRGQDEMPSERGMNADMGGLSVTHFAHHDHIGILAQE